MRGKGVEEKARPTSFSPSPLTPSPLRAFLVAWHFLTAVPLTRRHYDPTPQELAASMGWYPMVGLVLGGLLAATDLLVDRLFAPEVANLLVLLLLVVVTRGLHQDGLADTLDGLAGGRTPVERLAIMRDGRIGAIGATGLFLALALRYAGLLALPSQARLPVLLCMPAFGRWAMVVAAWAVPYARTEGGLAAPFLDHLVLHHVVVATLVIAGALSVMFGLGGVVTGLAVGALLARACAALCRRFFGGVTGDTLGATNEVVETVFLLAGAALLSLR